MSYFIKNNNLLLKQNTITNIDYYWIPTEDEWYKAAYYDPTLNNGSGGYWKYATRSDIAPVPVTADSIGNGSAGNTGNFANYAFEADWAGLDGNLTSVGTNGGPSYYGTYDQNGNVWEWTDGVSEFHRIRRGGSWGNYSFHLISSHRSSADPNYEFVNHGLRIAKSMETIDNNNFVVVNNINNTADSTGFGFISYEYQIGLYSVTNTDYIEFLNAIAITDTNNVFNTSMTTNDRGGIIRDGTQGNFSYYAKNNMGNKPVNFISWFDSARYCNWLTNGRPQGYQNLSTTEDGTYYLNGINTGIIVK